METACYLCGSLSNHSYDCPKYSSPKVAKVISRKDGQTWRIAKILRGQTIPKWATHAWYLNNTSNVDVRDLSKSSSTLEELADHWGNTLREPMKIPLGYLDPGTTHSDDTPIVVFAVME